MAASISPPVSELSGWSVTAVEGAWSFMPLMMLLSDGRQVVVDAEMSGPFGPGV